MFVYLHTFVLPVKDLEFRSLYEIGRTAFISPVAVVSRVRPEIDVPLLGAVMEVRVQHGWNKHHGVTRCHGAT